MIFYGFTGSCCLAQEPGEEAATKTRQAAKARPSRVEAASQLRRGCGLRVGQRFASGSCFPCFAVLVCSTCEQQFGNAIQVATPRISQLASTMLIMCPYSQCSHLPKSQVVPLTRMAGLKFKLSVHVNDILSRERMIVRKSHRLMQQEPDQRRAFSVL